MIKEDVKDEHNELRDYADDMVLFKEGDAEEEAISGLYKDLMIFVQSTTGYIIWHQTSPDYKGRVGQA
eukprot:8661855-Heterocapsa_arctica.AAC.1